MGTQNKKALAKQGLSVPGAGIEPARDYSHWFLRPTRLPIPPSGRLPKRTLGVQMYRFISDKQKIFTLSLRASTSV